MSGRICLCSTDCITRIWRGKKKVLSTHKTVSTASNDNSIINKNAVPTCRPICLVDTEMSEWMVPSKIEICSKCILEISMQRIELRIHLLSMLLSQYIVIAQMKMIDCLPDIASWHGFENYPEFVLTAEYTLGTCRGIVRLCRPSNADDFVCLTEIKKRKCAAEPADVSHFHKLSSSQQPAAATTIRL